MTNTIAETTLEQLGGANKLAAMIGASKFSHNVEGALTFHFKGCKKANILKIELNRMDLYNVTFYKMNNRTYDTKEIKKITNLFAPDLKANIEEFTGLYLTI